LWVGSVSYVGFVVDCVCDLIDVIHTSIYQR
jgi:hypothetical protein